ncbi:hypothetical protein DSO57_1028006 [Entomophthora muscae]|uniref:Uncharacterized protein n=1 Tax=Entomophthora muscae TaxID=34485 RepID=A0ACC2SE78_9FUNG|nr:hypothetical protein DSO57_1028006 [Entomophthora muscae]
MLVHSPPLGKSFCLCLPSPGCHYTINKKLAPLAATITAAAVVLENESYNLLVGYEVPLIFEEPVKVPGKRLKMCALEHPTGVFALKYFTHLSNIKCPPMACPASEGIPLLATSSITILPGSQAILDSQISYKLPESTLLEL